MTVSAALMHRFARYGGGAFRWNGWVITPFAMLRGEVADKDATGEIRKSTIPQIRALLKAALVGRIRVAIEDDVIKSGMLTNHRTNLPESDARGYGINFVFVDVIKALAPDKVVRVRVKPKVYAVGAIKGGKVLAVFMPALIEKKSSGGKK